MDIQYYTGRASLPSAGNLTLCRRQVTRDKVVVAIAGLSIGVRGPGLAAYAPRAATTSTIALQGATSKEPMRHWSVRKRLVCAIHRPW